MYVCMCLAYKIYIHNILDRLGAIKSMGTASNRPTKLQLCVWTLGGGSGGRGEGVSYLLMLIKVRRRDGKVPQLLSLMQAASSGQQLCLSNCQMGHQATVVVAHCAGKELFGIQLIVQRERERAKFRLIKLTNKQKSKRIHTPRRRLLVDWRFCLAETFLRFLLSHRCLHPKRNGM